MRAVKALWFSGFFLAQATPVREDLPKFYMQSGTGGTGHVTGGHSWYQRVTSIFQYEAKDGEGKFVANFGMGGTWLEPYGANYPFHPCEHAATSRDIDFTTIEGGFGYHSSKFGRQPKWRVGDSVGCYRSYTQSSMFHTGEANPGACSWEESGEPKRSLGLAQLSNRLLLFPDGHSFERDGMIGVSYARTPFGKNSASDKRNYWTLMFDTENYAGPVAYFVPEFWKLRAKGDEKATQNFTDFSDTPEIQNIASPAWECHGMPNYVDGGVHKLLKMALPQVNGRTVLWMGQRSHQDSEMMDLLEEALSTGKLDPTLLLKGGTGPQCKGHGDASFGDVAAWATFNDVIDEAGDCLWTLKIKNSSCSDNGMCNVPQFYKNGAPVDPSQASAALREARFPMEPISTSFKYDALSVAPSGGCRDSPGPADNTLYCAQSVDDTWIGYRWYRFVDQPALAQQKLSTTQKKFMQERVETLHRMAPSPVNKWINGRNADAEGMARMDPAAIATPPSGLEVGYVPIILYQSLAKPHSCVHAPTPAPAPPGANGIWIYGKDGSSRLFLGESSFTANSHRRGALAWDACSGATFENGRPIFVSGEGSKIGSVEASGTWSFRSAKSCALAFNYPGLALGGEFAAADGRQSAGGINYIEVQPRGVWIYERDGSGKVFVGEGSFASNTNRGGALAWDACGAHGTTFDNGRLLWDKGSKIGAVQVVGGWTLQGSAECAASYSYPGLVLDQAFTFADGKQSVRLLNYLEFVGDDRADGAQVLI